MKTTIDLFEQHEKLPQQVKDIIYSYGDNMSYTDCAELVQRLNAIGYTCEYYLDATPYNLRKL